MDATVAVIGTTTWGTALGIILARKNIPVRMLARTAAEAEQLQSDRRNVRFLPNAPFPDSLTISDSVAQVVASADLIIVAVPSHTLRHNIQKIRDCVSPGVPILSAAKGLELPSGKRMSQVMEEELPGKLHPGICAISGPNFAGGDTQTGYLGQSPGNERGFAVVPYVQSIGDPGPQGDDVL